MKRRFFLTNFACRIYLAVYFIVLTVEAQDPLTRESIARLNASDREELYKRLAENSDTFSDADFKILVENGLNSSNQKESTAALLGLFWKTLGNPALQQSAPKDIDPKLKESRDINIGLKRSSESANNVLKGMSLSSASVLFPNEEWVASSIASAFRGTTNINTKLDCLKMIKAGPITNQTARTLLLEAKSNPIRQISSAAEDLLRNFPSTNRTAKPTSETGAGKGLKNE